MIYSEFENRVEDIRESTTLSVETQRHEAKKIKDTLINSKLRIFRLEM